MNVSAHLYNILQRRRSYLLFHRTVEARIGWIHPVFSSGDLDTINFAVDDALADILEVP